MDSSNPVRPCPLNISPDHLSKAHALLLDPPFPTSPSHSPSHSVRVHNLVVRLHAGLAPTIQPKLSLPLLRLLALLHDIADHKYLPPDIPSARKFLLNLLSQNLALDLEVADYVAFLCDNVSFSKQAKSVAIHAGHVLELDLVRDADRLEAIGAIGIARCFSYGGERGRPLASTRSHFDDKLLKIPSLLHTEPAKRLAEQRRDVMLQFVKAFDEEMAAASQMPTVHGEQLGFEHNNSDRDH